MAFKTLASVNDVLFGVEGVKEDGTVKEDSSMFADLHTDSSSLMISSSTKSASSSCPAAAIQIFVQIPVRCRARCSASRYLIFCLSSDNRL